MTRVLLVEDDMGDAALTRADLLSEDSPGFDLFHARSLEEAVGELSRGDFQIILLDLNLPDSHGLETVEAILRANFHTAIIVLSGQDDEVVAMDSVHAGAQDYILKGDIGGRQLRRAIRYAIERKRTERELYRRALYDDLTGLPSRSLLSDRWHGAIARAKRAKLSTAVLMIDIDNFKTINDIHGHLAGDRVLREVANRVESRLRGSDTIARFGGDEFVVLLENIHDRNDANNVALTIRTAIEEPMVSCHGLFTITASVGVAILHHQFDESLDHVIETADRDMYAQKNNKRGPDGGKLVASGS